MEKIILQLIKAKAKDRTLDLLTQLKRNFSKTNKLPSLPSNIQLLQSYSALLKEKKIERNLQIEHLLKKKAMKSQSGIVSVQVLTKPFYCPGQCIFCPNDPTMPKSYIKTEPGAMRALMNKFDPIKQVYNRLLSLRLTGHETDKIEMIVLGGTWDVYPKDYKIKFIKELYDACNTFDEYFDNIKMSPTKKYAHDTIDVSKIIKYSKTIKDALKKNEKTAHRIIGLTIETRPEYVTDINCQFRRDLGVTRVEMGLQSSDDTVLELNKRGHTVQQAREACHKLRQYGFKFSIHIMPGLYGATYRKDLKTFQDLYTDPYFKPDEIKFYPTSVIPNTQLYELYKQGKYKPLETEDIKKLIRQTFLDIIPPYTRIKRLIRDIPATEIVAGSSITNLSQLMHTQMRKELKEGKIKILKDFYGRLYGDYKLYITIKEYMQVIASFSAEAGETKQSNKNKIASSTIRNDGTSKQKENIETFIIGSKPNLVEFRDFVSLDTRSREIRHKPEAQSSKLKALVNLIIRKYQSSGGVEYFVSFEDELGYIYGFTRLLLPKLEETIQIKGLGKLTAMIRELHIYGNLKNLIKAGKNGKNISNNSSDASDNFSDVSDIQHIGLGRQLMGVAEQIAHSHKYKKLSVISGIGVREYYRKLGYKLEGTYMVKGIQSI